MYHKDTGENPSELRTLNIVEGKQGWYFTIWKDSSLLYQSKEGDRVAITNAGISYLDTLQRLEYEARQRQKGIKRGR